MVAGPGPPRQVSHPVARFCPQGRIHVQWLDLIPCAGYLYHSQICAPVSDSCIMARLGPKVAFMYHSRICSSGGGSMHMPSLVPWVGFMLSEMHLLYDI
jgi:hypothetical protein